MEGKLSHCQETGAILAADHIESETEDLEDWTPNEVAPRILEVLADGQWHPRWYLEELAGGKLGRLLNAMQFHPHLAESDSGRWWCIPDERTPLYAPDEVDQSRGAAAEG